MSKRISLGAALSVLMVVAAFVFSVTMKYSQDVFNKRVANLREREAAIEKYAEIDRLVRRAFVGEINPLSLNNSVANGYIQGIGDRYGRYISAEELAKKGQDTASGTENVGIGAVIDVAPDGFYLIVKEVYSDSPAEVAGIKPDDLIIKIDDVDITHDNAAEMLESITGAQGSTISVITRRGVDESIPLVITRRQVSLPTVKNVRLLDGTFVGYMYISDFNERTYDQFTRETMRLADSGMRSMIIDLRDCKSDYLLSATRIVDRLLGTGIIAQTVDKTGVPSLVAWSDAAKMDFPFVILTNRGTTGSAEVFAQAVRDFGAGHLVGELTFGKGVKLETFKLSDGSAVELTVAKYVSKNRETWDLIGIRPDYEVPLDVDWTTLLDFPEQDAQLVKARELAQSMEKIVPLPETSQSDTEALPDLPLAQ